MKTVGREQILDKVGQWSRGTITPVEMHAWVTDLLLGGDIEYEDWEGDGRFSVTREVLAELEMLDMNLITRDDAPIFIEFLRTSAGDFETGYIAFISRLQSIDPDERRQSLKNTEPYAKYCL